MTTLIRQGSRGDLVKYIQRALHLYPDGIFGKATDEAVREFQKQHHLAHDGIVGAATLALLLPRFVRRSRRTITEIIIHCTATPAGRDYSVADIRRWHLAKGWSDIGYHFVVGLDGTIKAGRDVDIIGAHCQGHNTRSIGIVYVGGLASDGHTPVDTRTPEQKGALSALVAYLKAVYPRATVYGHRDFANKACPCFDAKKEYK